MSTFFQRNRDTEALGPTEMWKPADRICNCGRLTIPVHCHECGSAFIYALAKERKEIKIPSQNVTILVRAFRCRRCDLRFHEDDPCVAPTRHEGNSVIDQKAAKAAEQRGSVSFSQKELNLLAEKLKRGVAEKYKDRIAAANPEKLLTSDEQVEMDKFLKGD